MVELWGRYGMFFFPDVISILKSHYQPIDDELPIIAIYLTLKSVVFGFFRNIFLNIKISRFFIKAAED